MKRYCILKCLILICLLFCVAEGRAQFDARFSQYWVVKGYYHPGWAGQTDNKMNIYGSYGMQLMGFTHAPRVMYFGADMPFSLNSMALELDSSMKPSDCSATSVFGDNTPTR